jgi:hypothetical protein
MLSVMVQKYGSKFISNPDLLHQFFRIEPVSKDKFNSHRLMTAITTFSENQVFCSVALSSTPQSHLNRGTAARRVRVYGCRGFSKSS